MRSIRTRLIVGYICLLSMLIAGPLLILVWQSSALNTIHLAILGICIVIALCALLLVHVTFVRLIGALAVFTVAQQAAQHDDFVEVAAAALPPELQHIAISYNQMIHQLEQRRSTLHEQLRRTALLMRLAIELRETFETNEVIQDTLRVITTNTDACGASILLLNFDGAIETACEIERGQVETIAPERARAIVERGLGGWVLQHRRGVILNDTDRDARWQPFEGSAQACSVISLPLTHGKTILGVLTITHAHRDQFSSSDLLMLESVAAQAGLALSATMRYAEERRSREQALLLFAMSQDTTNKHTARELAQTLLEKSSVAFQLAGGYLFLGDSEGHQLLWFASHYEHTPLDAVAAHLPTQLADKAWRSHETVIESLAPDAADGTGLAIAALPLLHHGTAIGAFVAVRRARGTAIFSARTWSALTIFTNVAASAFMNLHLIGELHHHTEALERLVAIHETADTVPGSNAAAVANTAKELPLRALAIPAAKAT